MKSRVQSQVKRRITYVLVVATVALLLAAFTCHQAMQTSVGVAASLKAMQDGEIGLHNIGKIDDGEHRLIQQRFKALAQTDKSVRQCIYLQGGGACVDPGITAVQSMLESPEVIGIKNDDSRKQIEVLGQSLLTSLNALKAAL